MTAHLFVYGTLVPQEAGTFGAHERMRLAAEADLIGPATTDGVLFDLGDYPGLADGDGLVHGAVYRLRNTAATFAWLDGYEGVTGTEGDDYVRRVRAVTIAARAMMLCWVYVFVQSTGERRRIESGRWSAHRGGARREPSQLQ